MIKEKIKTGYKSSPLGLIPKDWEVKRLGEIGELKNGINKDKDDFGFGFPMINLMDVFGINKVYKNNLKLGLVNSNERDIKEFSLEKGDVLFIRSSVKPSGVGLTTLICDKLVNTTYSGFIIRFRDNGYLDFEFKAHCFLEENFRTRLLNKSTISANTNINQSALNSLSLIVPTLPEQTAIANLLSTWDKAIQNTTQLIEQKEQRKKWLMQVLLTGKKRVKGFEKEKWRKKTLDDCVVYTSREVPKPSSSFFALGIRCHAKGIFHKNDFEPEDLAMDVLYEVKENDLIVNITFAWEHAIAIAGKQDDGGLVSHRFPTYTFKTETAIPDFFRYLILQKEFKYKLDLISPGGAGRNRVMSKKDFPKLEVFIPHVKEQKAIANILNTSFEEIELLQKKLNYLKEQKKGLMQVLLTGKKRLNLKK